MADLETPPTSADLSDDDKLAMALIALATTGVGGLVGGRQGAMSGAVAGGKGAGMVAQDKADKEKKAEEIAAATKAKEATRLQGITDQKGLIDYKDELDKKKPKVEEYTDNDGAVRQGSVDPATGKVVKNSNADPVVKPAEPKGPKQEDLNKIEEGLRDDYRKDPMTVKTQNLRSAYEAIVASQPTAQGDMALTYGYMKILDDKTGVKEGEQAQASNAGGIPEHIRNAYNKALSGERLTPEQRAAFKSQAKALVDAQNKMQSVLYNQYAGLAGRKGVKKENVLLDEDPLAAPKTINVVNAKTGEKLSIPIGDLADAQKDGFEVEK